MINIKMIENMVKHRLDKEPSGHDYQHALRVLNNATIISKDLEVDFDVIKIACLVHDLIDDKLEPQYKLSKKELNILLKESNCEQDTIDKVFYIIENMSYRKHQTLDSLEGKLTQDADRLDALGAIGIARTFSFGGAHKRKMLDDQENELTSVGHFYDKLFKLKDLMNTENALKEAEVRTKFMVEYIEELKRETGINKFRE